MTEKKLKEWIRKKIRALDEVLSTGTFSVVRPEDKYDPTDECLIEDEEEGDDWGPWR
jgi:hypothetical protein